MALDESSRCVSDKARAARYCEIQPRYEAIGAVLREQFVI